VLVVDDHLAFGQAIAHVLESQEWVDGVTVAASGSEAREIACSEDHDVLLVDQRLGDTSGTDLVRWISERKSAPAVLISSEVSDAVLLDAVHAGCCGVIDKAAHVDSIVQAVRNASNGTVAMPDTMMCRLIPLLKTGANEANDLSTREMEVLHEVAAGHSNATIAARLYLSVHTVRNHIATILRKLDAHSKLQAVAVARERGLLNP
jgi:DNA-binding NarL/FixJ family response regulator